MARAFPFEDLAEDYLRFFKPMWSIGRSHIRGKIRQTILLPEWFRRQRRIAARLEAPLCQVPHPLRPTAFSEDEDADLHADHTLCDEDDASRDEDDASGDEDDEMEMRL